MAFKTWCDIRVHRQHDSIFILNLPQGIMGLREALSDEISGE